jgi:hypothetical protein
LVGYDDASTADQRPAGCSKYRDRLVRRQVVQDLYEDNRIECPKCAKALPDQRIAEVDALEADLWPACGGAEEAECRVELGRDH